MTRDTTSENSEEASDENKPEYSEISEEYDTVRIVFTPQEWVTFYGDERAVETGDRVRFRVPVCDITDSNDELFQEPSYELDSLKHHENAPEVVKEWEGPFEISIGEFL